MFTLDSRSIETQTAQWSLMNKRKRNNTKKIEQVKNRWVNDHRVLKWIPSVIANLNIYMAVIFSSVWLTMPVTLTLLPSSKKEATFDDVFKVAYVLVTDWFLKLYFIRLESFSFISFVLAWKSVNGTFVKTSLFVERGIK